MFLLEDVVIYSASDLTAAAHCEWAVMRKLDAKLGRIEAVVEEADAMLTRAGALGDEHELRYLEQLKLTRDVAEFERPQARDYVAAAAATAEAFHVKRDVLFQATFFDGRFIGFADFIMLNTDGVYEVFDTKLARKAKITAVMQLAAYSDQLLALGVPIGEEVHLLLGDGTQTTHQLKEIMPVYRRRRDRLVRIIDERVADDSASPWGDERYGACGSCSACTEQVALHRDVLLVAGMRMTQRKKLAAAGVSTIEHLAERMLPVPGLAAATLTGLREQAAIQLTATPDGAPAVRVFAPEALAAIPEPDAGDIFFDFEGDPLYRDGENGAWGIDYLFGLIENDGTFVPFWAHDLAQERVALQQFLAYVAARRTTYPNMHIYHYASYERTHLLSIAARHGVGEDEVDGLLAENVLVDLYPIVKKSVRVGSRSYSIKKLEPLYMGADHRTGVDNAADSITEYADARALIAAGETLEGQAKLDDIADYNRYDCVSTLKLRDWLLGLGAANGVPRASARDQTLEIAYSLREPSPVYLKLAAAVADIVPAERTADETAIALASAAIDYHRREGKKFWQEHFDRLRNPVDEWADTRDVLVIGTAEVVRDWGLIGKARNPSRDLVLTGELAPGSSYKPGHEPFLLYEAPFPPIEESTEPGARYAHYRAEITDVVDGEYFLTERLRNKGEPYDQLPMALAPAKQPDPGTQVTAIAEWGQRVIDALPEMLPDAALDILRRQPPRGGLVPVATSAVDKELGAVGEAIRDSLLQIDRSYLAVQGPPGTGKTRVGSRVIAELVTKFGWKIGVVSQGHSTVENMLSAVLKAGVLPGKVGKKLKSGEKSTDGLWTVLPSKSFAEFTDQAGGYVLGGTAWDFSNDTKIERGSLDLLVIDEAGQFSLASTIASAVAAKRLLLLGDPQQLPQVSTGSHPEPVDVSALGWLADGHDVLPPELGYFLAASWRMHPDVCTPVSRLSYEGRLESVGVPRELAGIVPGLHAVPVRHSFNSTSSPEEADRIVEIVRDLLGRSWTDETSTRAVTESNIIVVAPYNAQVELIRERLAEAGLAGVPVGTVDKFQGQEAAVAVISLAASSAEEVPRGLEFLLLANRLNVAISRAQWAAYLVYSPALTEFLPGNFDTLAKLSAFIELVDGAV
jgi:predicted RecB family nuclease